MGSIVSWQPVLGEPALGADPRFWGYRQIAVGAVSLARSSDRQTSDRPMTALSWAIGEAQHPCVSYITQECP